MTKMLDAPEGLSPAYNLGPTSEQVISVRDAVAALNEVIPKIEIHRGSSPLKEASQLQLDSTLARKELAWKPRWDGLESIRQTAFWYLGHAEGLSAEQLCQSQIDSWES